MKAIIQSYKNEMQMSVVARVCRNRRIGDFLKELDLTEGKSTGFPIIRDAMANNGSPEPIFYTDDNQVLFMVTLPCHPEFKVTKSVSKLIELIDFLNEEKTRNEILLSLSSLMDLLN